MKLVGVSGKKEQTKLLKNFYCELPLKHLEMVV